MFFSVQTKRKIEKSVGNCVQYSRSRDQGARFFNEGRS